MIKIIEEEITVTVITRIGRSESIMQMKLWSDDKFQKVASQLRDETEEPDWTIVYNEEKVKEKALIGSIITEDFEVIAMDQEAKDVWEKDRKEKRRSEKESEKREGRKGKKE